MRGRSPPERQPTRRRRRASGRDRGEKSERGVDRGQAYTLEGVAAALLLLASVVFVLEATAVTPLSASSTTEHTESQGGALARGLLDAAVANGSADAMVRYWNTSNGTFHGTVTGPYSTGPPTVFGAMINRTFVDRGYGIDVNLYYTNTAGDLRRVELVDLGRPSDDAVAAQRTVTLTDDDVILAADGSPTGDSVAGAPGYFAPDAAPGSPLYHVVTVEVVVWPS